MRKLFLCITLFLPFFVSSCVTTSLGIHRNGTVYYVDEDVNLKGRVLRVPDGCNLVFRSGSIANGKVLLNNTFLIGNVNFRCRVFGTIKNDTVKVSWFNYQDHKLSDALELSEGKTLEFENNRVYQIDYALLIPSCNIAGNNSIIVLDETNESSPNINVAKIRNAHYDGGGIDSFSIKNLHFETSEDNLFLFSIQNTKNCTIIDCSFTSKGDGRKISHVFDMRGHNKNTILDHCRFVNESDARTGGGLWIRSFGEISGVEISNSYFYNNSTDEILAFNAIESSIKDVRIESCHFEYERGVKSPEPHVMWGMTYKSGGIDDVEFYDCHLKSDFIPAYILNDVRGDNVMVVNCSFSFEGATLNAGKLNSILFNGRLSFENSSIVFTNNNRQDETTSVTLFSGLSFVRHSTIINNCKDVFLGAPNIYYSNINYNNSQLFNGYLPKEMVGCRIKLGIGTPKLAANPYVQNVDCVWVNNIIESDRPVDFNFSYKKNYLRNVGNQMRNITVQGTPFKN